MSCRVFFICYHIINLKSSKPEYTSLDKLDFEYDLPLWSGASLEARATFFIPTRDNNSFYRASKDYKGAQLYMLELNQSVLGGFNKTVLQYFHGSNANYSAFGTGNWLDYTGASNKAYRWTLINFGVVNFTERFGMMHQIYGTVSGGYDNNLGSDNYTDKDSDKAFSLVVRPFYKLTKMTRLYLEAGFYTESVKYKHANLDLLGNFYGSKTENTQGQKYTLAYAITPDAGNFWSRPEIRFYVSYLHAKNGDLSSYGNQAVSGSGIVNGQYLNYTHFKNSETVFGIQAEAWW